MSSPAHSPKRGLCAELFEVVLQSHELLISDHVLPELERILPEKLGQSQPVTDGFVSLLRSEALLIAAQHAVPSLPDLDDEVIAASALAPVVQTFLSRGTRRCWNFNASKTCP